MSHQPDSQPRNRMAHDASTPGASLTFVGSPSLVSAESEEPSEAVESKPAGNRFSRNKDKILEAFRNMFYGLGGFIFDHAIVFIVCSTLIALICGISFLSIDFETRADLLYALPASRARSDLAKQTALFGKPPRVNMVFVVSDDNSSVLTGPVLRKLENLDRYIKTGLRSAPIPDGEGKPEVALNYQDVCYRMTLPDVDFSAVQDPEMNKTQMGKMETDCYAMSALDLYRNEKQYGRPLSTRQWPYVPNMGLNKIVKADLVLSDPEVVRLPSGTVRLFNSTGYLMIYHTISGTKHQLARSLEWERSLINFVNGDLKPSAADSAEFSNLRASLDPALLNSFNFSDHEWKEFKVFVNAQRSWQDELGRSTSLDARLIRDYCLAYLIIASYMIIFNRTNNLVRSKSVCGFLGSLSALLGFLCGGGICYWLGLRHTPTMHASPFLVLAIGLDNTFVVLNFYTLAFNYLHNPKERCRRALCDSGISLTITTSTSIISFLVGAAGPYLAVRNFCLITAMGLLGGFIFNILFFYPFLCLEAVAESEGRISFLPIPLKIYDMLPHWTLTPDTAKWLQRQRAGTSATFASQAAFSANQSIGEGSTRVPATLPNERTGTFGDPFTSAEPRVDHPSETAMVIRHHRPTYSSDGPDYSQTFSSTGRTISDGRTTSDSQPTAADSLENLPRRGQELDALKCSYLQETLLKNRSLFEVASLQWRFRQRRAEVAEALKAAHMALPDTRQPDSRQPGSRSPPEAELLPQDVSQLMRDDEDIMMKPAKDLPQSLLAPLYRMCALVIEVTDEPAGNNGKWSRSFFLDKLGPIWTNVWLRAGLVSLMVVYIAVSLYGAVKHLSAGLDLENLTPPDSYLREAFAMSHSKFPIFPYETNVLFTAPDLGTLAGGDASHGHKHKLLGHFGSDHYGTRKPSDLKPISLGDPSLYAGNGGDTLAEMQPWLQSLGEVPWWETSTLATLMEVDKNIRGLETTQDLLNGLLLFFSDNAQRVFVANTTAAERRVLFHKNLYRWLSGGVVGPHVRDQFHFADPSPDDPEHLPRLLGYKMAVFHYNFLNSYEQSQYMVKVRALADSFSTDWSAVVRGASTVTERSMRAQDVERAPLPDYEGIREAARLEEGEGESLVSWFSVKPFMETFVFFESDVTILMSTIVNMSTAFLAIIIVSSLLMRGVGSAVLVTLMICAVDLGIFGAMGFWGIHLNIVSMILLVLSIGFSVDYTVHVVHTFTHALGPTRNHKTVETLILMCTPVTHGAVSTMLGILPIYFRQEFIMETFFRMTLLVIAFGFLNGVIFLPIILSLKGPTLKSTNAHAKAFAAEINNIVRPLMLGTYDKVGKLADCPSFAPLISGDSRSV